MVTDLVPCLLLKMSKDKVQHQMLVTATHINYMAPNQAATTTLSSMEQMEIRVP